ncbi:MAG: FliM/FliN family flagellar motor switch protein [Planctomycetota bacterium]
MTAPQTTRYDFAAAARVKRNLRAQLQRWLDKTAEAFQEKWATLASTVADASCPTIDANRFELVQEGWSTETCGFQFSLHDKQLLGLAVIQRIDMLVLLMGLLGDVQNVPEDRPLTSVEISLATMVFETTTSCLSEAWQGLEPISVDQEGFDSTPKRSRRFSPDTEVLICDLSIRFGEQASTVQLVTEKLGTAGLLGVETSLDASSKQPISRDKLTEIDVVVVAELGQAQIDMTAVSKMQNGDILLLNQPVDEAIPVFANGQRLFEAWPGRRHQQRVVKISSTSGEKPNVS